MAKIPTDYGTEREESKNRDQEPDRKRWRRKKAQATGQREGGPKRWGQRAGQREMEKEDTQKKKSQQRLKRGGQGSVRKGPGRSRGVTGPQAWDSLQLLLSALLGDSATSDASLCFFPPFLFRNSNHLSCNKYIHIKFVLKPADGEREETL